MSEWLASLGFDALARPAWLWPALAVALLGLLAAWRRREPVLGWPDFAAARSAGARRLDPLGWLGRLLRAGALLALAVVLAGPVGLKRAPPEPGLGLDLVLVVDASGSMRALDARVDDRWRTRLDLARQVVSRFAERRAAEGDRVALVVFGDAAFTQCPLTSDGALLGASLERVEAGVAGESTALGDALGLAVKRALAGSASGSSAAPVVVLLTDGRSNAGTLSVETATALAHGAGVRVHTVAIGSAGEEVPMATAGRRSLRLERHDVDTETLRGIAVRTGGRFFEARGSGDLPAVYAEIDALERVERPLPPQRRATDHPEPLLAAAGVLLLGELTLLRVARRRLP